MNEHQTHLASLDVDEAWIVPYGHNKRTTFMSERMDFENCSLFHPVYYNDYSSFCLKSAGDGG